MGAQIKPYESPDHRARRYLYIGDQENPLLVEKGSKKYGANRKIQSLFHTVIKADAVKVKKSKETH